MLQFAEHLKVESNGRTLSPKIVNGTPVFVDLDVVSYYVADYTMSTKDASSFGSLIKKVFGEKTPHLRLKFSRACSGLSAPIFNTVN